mmetsp:Transcript_26887/g.58318  ORF Transcript_26887/g.58318 Transcript_26887/m.58318 type:complete len:218 (+) Transcript_26887:79-732(+)
MAFLAPPPFMGAGDAMEIFVITPDEQRVTLSCRGFQLVEELKQLVSPHMASANIDSFGLHLEGKRLWDWATVDEASITALQTLTVALRPENPVVHVTGTLIMSHPVFPTSPQLPTFFRVIQNQLEIGEPGNPSLMIPLDGQVVRGVTGEPNKFALDMSEDRKKILPPDAGDQTQYFEALDMDVQGFLIPLLHSFSVEGTADPFLPQEELTKAATQGT